MSVANQTRKTLMAFALVAMSWQTLAIAQSAANPTISAQTQNLDSLLDQSYNAMYNLRFDEALRLAESAKRMATDDPVPWMAQACAVLFREFDHMHILRSELFASDDKFIDGPAFTWDPQRRKDFDTALTGAERLAQERLKQRKDDPRALFALTLVTGLRADDAALIAKKKFSALSYTKKWLCGAPAGALSRLLRCLHCHWHGQIHYRRQGSSGPLDAAPWRTQR